MIARLTRCFLLVALAAVFMLTPTIAQPPRDWTAWLYTPGDGTITQVAPSGVVAGQLFLPLTPATNLHGPQVLVSSRGRFVAYTAYDSTGAIPGEQLFVYDVRLGSIIYNYELSAGDTHRLAPYQTAFDELNNQFAFGYHADDTGWRLVIADLSIGVEFDALAQSEAANIGAGLPVVLSYDGRRVTFALSPLSGAVNAGTPAYVWDVGTDEVTAVNGALVSMGDLLAATGERVFPTRADDLAAAGQGANALVVLARSGERTLVYHDAVAELRSATFIEDGARVLVEMFTPASGTAALRVLNRDGSVAGELVGALSALRGTPDGFTGLFDSPNGSALAYVATTTTPYAPVTLWSAGAGVSVQFAAVVASGQPPTAFGPWGRVE